MKVIAIVAAASKDRVIGNNGSIPWDEPADRKFFQTRTMGATLIMGRKTFESLKGAKLPGREIIVVTRQEGYNPRYAEVASTPFEALDMAMEEGNDIYVAGGQDIYEALLPECSEVYCTVIGGNWEGDTYFPVLEYDEWKRETEYVLGKNQDGPVVQHYRRWGVS